MRLSNNSEEIYSMCFLTVTPKQMTFHKALGFGMYEFGMDAELKSKMQEDEFFWFSRRIHWVKLSLHVQFPQDASQERLKTGSWLVGESAALCLYSSVTF